MKKQFLNLGKALNKAEQKQIFGGVSDGCRIAVRNSDGSFAHWSTPVYFYEEVEGDYASGTVYSDGSYASGYSCASC
ncbi:hypothetical protein MKD41_00225 [Lutibacter sp. A64]|uniref:hypothetical protein n=1 Tax=Lutibacter sp. A64 TaxID=2918526 RepID=UPI001F05554E|nr:hypothetical protein [Lutibacter sp. A64]UMB53924.1 hypothetical protein MKD41_00225 [Lutibacter sp. A64]